MFEFSKHAKILIIEFLDSLDQQLHDNQHSEHLKESSDSVLDACVALNNTISENILFDRAEEEAI